MTLVLTVIAVFLLLLASEWWWHKRQPHGEASRKFIHVTVGGFAAFWPYFLETWAIVLLSVAFVVVVLVSKHFNIFKAIHAVERPTWGELYFAVAVGLLSLLAPSPAIYTAALLHMAFADGLAAIIGTKYGAGNSYRVLKHKKSIAGTAAFLICSLAILIVYATVQPYLISPVYLVGLALLAAALENVSVKGMDNLLVPVVVAAVLGVLA